MYLNLVDYLIAVTLLMVLCAAHISCCMVKINKACAPLMHIYQLIHVI